MTKFILHGGYASTDNESNRDFFSELSKDVSDGGKILVVCFAVEDNLVEQKFIADRERITAASPEKSLVVEIAREDKFTDQVATSDCIYLRGGNTKKLLKTLRQTGITTDWGINKIIAGESAGAYALSAFYFSHSEGKVEKGLNLFPVRVICHHQSQIHVTSDNAVEALETCHKELPLVVLRDYEWRVFRV